MSSYSRCLQCDAVIRDDCCKKHHTKCHIESQFSLTNYKSEQEPATRQESNNDDDVKMKLFDDETMVLDTETKTPNLTHIRCKYCFNLMPADVMDSHVKRKHSQLDPKTTMLQLHNNNDDIEVKFVDSLGETQDPSLAMALETKTPNLTHIRGLHIKHKHFQQNDAPKHALLDGLNHQIDQAKQAKSRMMKSMDDVDSTSDSEPLYMIGVTAEQLMNMFQKQQIYSKLGLLRLKNL